MDHQNDKIPVLIIGATGNLGSLITKHCLANPNFLTNILVRDPQKNKELASQVEKAGGKVHQGDILKPETIKGITQGIHTVIFSVSFEPSAVLDGQKAVINDCVANGVKRVVPTEYSMNWEHFTNEEKSFMPPIVLKKQVEEYLKDLPLKVLQLNTGLFTETFYAYLFAKEFGYWGDAEHKFQLTSYDDTAKFITAAVARKDLEGRLAYVGNEVSLIEAAEIYNKVRGTKKEAKFLGSLEEIKKKATEAGVSQDPSSFFLGFASLIFDERSRFTKVANQDFPEVKSSTVEEVLKENPHIQVSN